MKSVNKIITNIKDDLQASLPGILSGMGVSDFEMYGVGYPTDQSKKFCAARYRAGSKNEIENFTFTVHISVIGETETEAYKYMDTVNIYLQAFSPYKFGFTNFNYDTELLENFRAGDIQAFFDVTMSAPADDCEG